MARLDAVRTSSGLVIRRAAKNADADAEQDRQQRQKPRRVLHLENAAISFIARFLNDDRPVQIADRTIGAQHLRALLALGDFEFAGGGDQLRLSTLFEKIAYDFRVGHVLAGRVLGSRARDQPAFTIHDVRGQVLRD